MPIAKTATLGRDVTIHHPDLVNLYGCRIGDGTKIGAFVEIQKNAAVGRLCKISSQCGSGTESAARRSVIPMCGFIANEALLS